MKNIPGARGIPDRHLEAFRPEKTILRRHPHASPASQRNYRRRRAGLQQLPAALLIGQIPEHIPVEKFRGDKNIQTGKQLYNPLLIIIRIHHRYNAVLPGKKSCRRAGRSAVFQMKVFCFAQIFIIDFLRQQFSCGALLADKNPGFVLLLGKRQAEGTGGPRGIHDDGGGVHTIVAEIIDDKLAPVVFAHLGHHACASPQSGGSGHCGRHLASPLVKSFVGARRTVQPGHFAHVDHHIIVRGPDSHNIHSFPPYNEKW